MTINTKIIGGLGVLLLVAAMWSFVSIHPAEAKGMPKCWLNPDGTVKIFYQKILKSTSPNTKFPISAQHQAYCNK